MNTQHCNVQFPRLIAELNACGIFTDKDIMAFLRESMDLNDEEIMVIVDKAERRFENVKNKIAANKWFKEGF